MVEADAESKDIVSKAAGRREARADRFFAHDLKDRGWCSQKAGLFKDRFQRLSLAVITVGAAIAKMGVFAQTAWGSIATAVLGDLISVAKRWEWIARYDEAWMGYRVVSERMKRERWLYVNRAKLYRDLEDRDEAFLHFVEPIETIIAEEPQIYWSGRGDRTPPKAPANQGFPLLGTADQ